MSAAEDYEQTRILRNRSASVIKPKNEYIFVVCGNCNRCCTVEVPEGWNGTHHCKYCGGKMFRK